jgi:hypothetical protein
MPIIRENIYIFEVNKKKDFVHIMSVYLCFQQKFYSFGTTVMEYQNQCTGICYTCRKWSLPSQSNDLVINREHLPPMGSPYV